MKTEEKHLEEKLEELENLLSVQDKPSMHSRSMCNTRLAQKRPTKKPKGALSVKARAKREVSVKSKLPGAYIRRKKQKEKTHEVSERTHTLGLSLRGNPLSLSHSPFGLLLVIYHYLLLTFEV